MKDKGLSNNECIFYVYHSFASHSDGEFNNYEAGTINHLMQFWLKKEFNFDNYFQKTIEWNLRNNVSNVKEIKEVIVSISEYLNNQFDIIQKETFLMHLRLIASSDKNFHESEKKWHDLISKILGLDLRISSLSEEELNNDFSFTKRKPIGFKMSWQ